MRRIENAGSLNRMLKNGLQSCITTRGPHHSFSTTLLHSSHFQKRTLSTLESTNTHPITTTSQTRPIHTTPLRKAVLTQRERTPPRPPTTPPTPLTDLPTYHPPTTGLLSHLPAALIPYAELSRLDKPAGTYYLFAPCLFSTLLAAPLTPLPLTSIATTSALFLAGALLMRGAGCAINDLWDRNLDPLVARTRLRPIARGAITPRAALVWTGVQSLAGLGVLLQFPPQCLYLGIPSLLLVATYPLAKRVTHYPQAVLGLTFSWGAIMGWPALGVDLLAPGNEGAAVGAACLYASCVAWTVLYDMIYAHMDVRDDARAGIKSIALRHEKDTKMVLSGLAVVQVMFLAAAGVAVGSGPVFFVGGCGWAAGSLAVMIWRVRLKSVGDCWWWFRNGVWITGGGVAVGMLGDYLVRRSESVVEENGAVVAG